ncbi:MAG: hypothetical protein P4L74_01115 [Candidatus Doudnabacteria bacterium]|nr:hypothetical protein [Candidatus Doudnabacteria bacterium]
MNFENRGLPFDKGESGDDRVLPAEIDTDSEDAYAEQGFNRQSVRPTEQELDELYYATHGRPRPKKKTNKLPRNNH